MINFRKLWLDEPLGIDQILLEKRLFDYVQMLLVHSVIGQHFLTELLLDHSKLSCFLVLVETIVVLDALKHTHLGWVVLHVRVDHESCKGIVIVLVNFIFHHGQEVESGQDGSCQINVVIEVQSHVVGSLQGVCSSNDTAPCLKTGVDSSL